jgi:SpoVK/Ycf46/Vps4 family AAA+-type ATPase
VAAVADAFIPAWHIFARECDRINNAVEPDEQVIIIGGHRHAFVPNVNWADIVLPEKLAHDIRHDVETFFSKGVEVYQRLNLKPFRKLLFAGVPGTGKTMICSALAKWAIEQKYIVIYVSGARKRRGEEQAATFSKIQEAIDIAADSVVPTLILVEELDAFLHTGQKAQVLNVLDGNESGINPKGTLLIATTNYPEAIDERVLKRPGRLDRVFIIPEVRSEVDAEKMLRQYLGILWQNAHLALVPKLAGHPGAFIREEALYALVRAANDDLAEVPLDLLETSYKDLKEQISARDDLLKKRAPLGLPMPNGASSN